MTGKEAIKWLADYVRPYLGRSPIALYPFWGGRSDLVLRVAKAQVVLFDPAEAASRDILQHRVTGTPDERVAKINDLLTMVSRNEYTEDLQRKSYECIAHPPFSDFVLFQNNGSVTAYVHLPRTTNNPTDWDMWAILPLTGPALKKRLPFKYGGAPFSFYGHPDRTVYPKQKVERVFVGTGDYCEMLVSVSPEKKWDMFMLNLEINTLSGEGYSTAIKPHTALVFPEDLLEPLSLFKTFCNLNACVNTELKTTELTKKEVIPLTKNRIPTRSYHEIVIKSTPRRQYDTDSDEPTHTMPLHLCRGHIKHYSAEKPLFGRIVGNVWCPPHMRGREANGTVDKTYIVEAQS